MRSAKAVKITDGSLIKKLGLLCCFVGVALLVRTLVAPPIVIVGRTADNLKAFLCKTDWWDHTFTSSKIHFHERNLNHNNPVFSVYSGGAVSSLGRSLVYRCEKSSI